MALIQVNVPDDVKARADAAFARNGITTPAAMKMMVTQVANENRTPFDGVFSSPSARELGEDVRRDMLLAEAQEYGLVADDATDARTIPDDVLGELERQGLAAFLADRAAPQGEIHPRTVRVHHPIHKGGDLRTGGQGARGGERMARPPARAQPVRGRKPLRVPHLR